MRVAITNLYFPFLFKKNFSFETMEKKKKKKKKHGIIIEIVIYFFQKSRIKN